MRIGERTRFLTCAALLALVATSQSAQADVSAVTTPAGTPIYADTFAPVAEATYGWLFTVNDPDGILLTALGVWDEGADGLAEDHLVGIWDVNSASLFPVVSAYVPLGTVGTLDNGPGISDYRYAPTLAWANPLQTVLGPGTYVIGSTYSNPDILAPADRFLIDATVNETGQPEVDRLSPGQHNVSSLTIGSTTIYIGGGFTEPGTPGNPNGYFGPNFKYAAVPEPTPMALMGLTAVVGSGLAALRRRLRKGEGKAAADVELS